MKGFAEWKQEQVNEAGMDFRRIGMGIGGLTQRVKSSVLIQVNTRLGGIIGKQIAALTRDGMSPQEAQHEILKQYMNALTKVVSGTSGLRNNFGNMPQAQAAPVAAAQPHSAPV